MYQFDRMSRFVTEELTKFALSGNQQPMNESFRMCGHEEQKENPKLSKSDHKGRNTKKKIRMSQTLIQIIQQ